MDGLNINPKGTSKPKIFKVLKTLICINIPLIIQSIILVGTIKNVSQIIT